MEFGGSGEDSFVAVVVTKLTGALLFILLLTMVIMALLPKAIDLPVAGLSRRRSRRARTLAITTPETLPEAIAGRPYPLALAATGGQRAAPLGGRRQAPRRPRLRPETGLLRGTPEGGTPEPVGAGPPRQRRRRPGEPGRPAGRLPVGPAR